MMMYMAGMKEFGALIKRARENRGLTGVEVASRIGRQHSYIVRYEKGQASNPPDIRDFDALARELGLPKTQMLEALGYLDQERDAGHEEAGLEDVHARLDPYLSILDDHDIDAVVGLAELLARATRRRQGTSSESSSQDAEPSELPQVSPTRS